MRKTHLFIIEVVQYTLAKRSRKVAEAPTCAMSRNRTATIVVNTFCDIAGRIALKTKISQVTICQGNNLNNIYNDEFHISDVFDSIDLEIHNLYGSN